MKNAIKLLLGFIIVFSCSSTADYNIVRFGAVGDGETLNTEFIQKAIDECSLNGGGKVVVPKGKYLIGTIILKDNVTLLLEEDAELIGSLNLDDYINIDKFTDAVGQERGNCLIGAVDATNVALAGDGKINGRGEYFRIDSLKKKTEMSNTKKFDYAIFNKRPFLVRFVRSANVAVSGVHLTRSASWTLHCFQCKGVTISDISIFNRSNKNNDGIDLDSSSDIVISDCTIESEDDALCFKATSPVATENIIVSRCKLSSDWGAIKFGTESMGDFRNITIDSCQISNTKGGGIKILSVDGANIENITISNITMENVDMPIFMRLGARLRTYRNAAKQPIGSISNITLRNITAKVWKGDEPRINPPSGILITGIPEYKIQNLTLDNVKIELPGGAARDMRQLAIAENENQYPEYILFGILPAYGAFIRHAEKINLTDCIITTEKIDERFSIWLEDVHELKLNNLSLPTEDYWQVETTEISIN